MTKKEQSKTQTRGGNVNSKDSLYQTLTSETSRKAADALFKASEEELSNNFRRDRQQVETDQHSK